VDESVAGTVHIRVQVVHDHGLAGWRRQLQSGNELPQSFTINKRIKRSRSIALASKTFGDS
jgi:hypothetical protein